MPGSGAQAGGPGPLLLLDTKGRQGSAAAGLWGRGARPLPAGAAGEGGEAGPGGSHHRWCCPSPLSWPPFTWATESRRKAALRSLLTLLQSSDGTTRMKDLFISSYTSPRPPAPLLPLRGFGFFFILQEF